MVKVSSPPLADGWTPLKCGRVWTRQELYIKVRKQRTELSAHATVTPIKARRVSVSSALAGSPAL